MKLNRLTFILLLLFFSTILFAQTAFIPIMLDYTIYKGSNGQSYVEVYSSIYQNHLTYNHEADQQNASFLTTLEIMDGDSTIFKHSKETHSAVSASDTIRNDRQFVNLFSFELKPGNYSGKIKVEDKNSAKTGEYVFNMNILPFSADSLSLSQIELSSKITRQSQESEFNKNTLYVLPNPSKIYSNTLPMLYYYAELYNLSFDPELPGEYETKCSIIDMTGTTVKEFPVKRSKKMGKTAVLVNGYNIVTLPPAAYRLKVEITDLDNSMTDVKTKEFTFYKPGAQIAAQPSTSVNENDASQMSMYASYSEEQMDQEYEFARYIAFEQENRVYETLDANSKRKFLKDFWESRQNSAAYPHRQTPGVSPAIPMQTAAATPPTHRSVSWAATPSAPYTQATPPAEKR